MDGPADGTGVCRGGERTDQGVKSQWRLLSPETDRGTDADRGVWFLELSGRAGSSDR